jgi:UDP-N-acetylmuramoyl-L-alanyl-D-glutamate--2,6-diaminopimelate ligase
MIILKDILYKVSLLSTSGPMDREIEGICFDSRDAGLNYLFVAVKGVQADGHDYIQKAIENGASTVVCEQVPVNSNASISWIQVRNSSEALGIIASNFFGNPSQSLKVVAVTGTNGKTTTVTMLHSLFRKLGYGAGMLSTVNNRINERVIPSTHTTPDAIQLNRLMAEMVSEGCTWCFMEASSHALDQQRMSGIRVRLAIFTNITHDHLDYHKTFDAYIDAKKKLFDGLDRNSFALINSDDRRGNVMVQNTKALVLTYGLKSPADFKTKIISNTFQGLELAIQNKTGWFPLVGEFNAYNITAVYAAAVLLGEESEQVLTVLSGFGGVQGRFEVVRPDSGVNAIVDYAHTPDALENVLKTLQDLRTRNEKLITVIGCGGNRDREKRPKMASIACRFSDKVVLTSDNPRNEDPEMIIEEMGTGVPVADKRKTLRIVERREAIKAACSMAVKNDIILVAGKGHETYQEIKGVKYDFDDRRVLEEMIDLFFNN